MSPADAAAIVEQKIATDWGAGPGTPIAWPNVPFVPPSTGSWLKVDWLWGNGFTLTKGGSGVGMNTVVGVLQLAVFGPRDTGDGTLDTTAESARAIFNRLRMAAPNQDVLFGPVSGPVKQFEESWRSVVLSAPFQIHETLP